VFVDGKSGSAVTQELYIPQDQLRRTKISEDAYELKIEEKHVTREA
jgi:hypothetical protein